MRSSIVLGSLLATLAVATPINKALKKKGIVWDITTEIVWVTVTEGAPTSTTPPVAIVTVHKTVTAGGEPKTRHTHAHSSSSSVYVAPPAPTTSTTPAPVVVPTTSAAPVVEPTTEAKVAAAATTAAAVAPASPTDYISTALYHHNMHRANHSAGALVWDDTLAQYALATANTCVFAHDMTEGTAGYGQNLAAFGTTSDLSKYDLSTLVADAVTNQWYYGEAPNVPYGQDSPTTLNVPEFLHFTALVWKASTKVGCATVQCGAGTIFSYPSLYTVCDYATEGNVLGAFASNVVPPVGNGKPSISAKIS